MTQQSRGINWFVIYDAETDEELASGDELDFQDAVLTVMLEDPNREIKATWFVYEPPEGS